MKQPQILKDIIKESLDLVYKVEVGDSYIDEAFQDKLASRLHILDHWVNDRQYLRLMVKKLKIRERLENGQ